MVKKFTFFVENCFNGYFNTKAIFAFILNHQKQKHMKKGIMLAIIAGGFFTFGLTSCGETFTPLTDEQINAKVDSLFNEQKEAKLQELNAACQANAEAQAAAKFEELKNAAVASN